LLETDEHQRLAMQKTAVSYKLLHFVRFALSISRNRIRTGDIPSIAFCGLMAHLFKMALDHDKRRRDIAWITIDLIAREGLEAATIRRIAAEAGCNTTAITHLPRKPTWEGRSVIERRHPGPGSSDARRPAQLERG
jgi:hypothetical protein